MQTSIEQETHDPGAAGASRRAAKLLAAPKTAIAHNGKEIRVGVASWTDPTITAPGVFYPPAAKTAESRLHYYASIFPLVEVDSSYYALPTRRVAELWVERTPDDFTFNVKAYALMTGHPAELDRLPKALKDELPKDIREKRRAYAKDLPEEILDAVWGTFVDAITPLHDAGKLGAILLQYPRWFLANRANAAELARTRKRLGHLPAAVEFRNPRWLTPKVAERTFALLRDHGFSYVCVDTPRGLPSSIPDLTAVTNDRLAMVRLHGRRTSTWEGPVEKVSERFRYLYDREQLEDWTPRIAELADKATVTHVVFNNCYANYGTTNALELGELISRIYRKR